MHDPSTPFILIDAEVVRRNVAAMAAYASAHRLNLRPHTKTHKSTFFGRMQMEAGAVGLSVAKPGEAKVMAEVTNDLLMAYPAVGERACAELAELARGKTVRVGIDSAFAADGLAAAARSVGSTIGILVDLDVGHRRTGVQTAADALTVARHVESCPGLRLDGIQYFAGHLSGPADRRREGLLAVGAKVEEVLDLWQQSGLAAGIVSGGSTPTAYQSHLDPHLTEIRPGTYLFNDMNCVRGDCADLADCAARIVATVVSTAVPGQIVLDCGSKTLTSDRCGPAPDSGHGYVVELPDAMIVKLSEEHAQVDVSRCRAVPKLGERVTVIPNHICPCINLQDVVWWKEPGEAVRPLPVSARGRSF